MAVIIITRATPAPHLFRRQAVINGYTSVTYNNGMYTPIVTTTILPAVTDTDPDATLTTTLATSLSSSLDSISLLTPVPTTSSSSFSSSASVSPNSTSSATGTISNHHFQFRISYLIPLFAFVGFVLLLVLIGKTWGIYATTKDKAELRHSKHKQALLRVEEEHRIEDIQKQWRDAGWRESHHKGQIANIGFKQKYYHNGYESEFSEEEEKNEQLYMAEDHLSKGDYTQRGGSSEKMDPSLRATLRGTWNRVKLRITGNVGWGYNGTTPDASKRRLIVAEASNNHPWSRIDRPHTSEGLLFPPRLDDNGNLVMPETQRGRRTLFPFASNSPELPNPPNTIKAFPSNSSVKALASVKNLFSALCSRSGLHDGNQSTHLAKHSTYEDHTANTQIHTHEDGSRCSLLMPQYLPPTTHSGSASDKGQHYDQSSPIELKVQVGRTVVDPAVSVQRKTTQIQVKQYSIAELAPTSIEAEDNDLAQVYTARPTSSINRHHKSQKSIALSRTSTVRFAQSDNDQSDTPLTSSFSPGTMSEYSQISASISPYTSDSMPLISQVKADVETRCEKLLRKSKSMLDSPVYHSDNTDVEVHGNQIELDEIVGRSNSKRTTRSYTEAVKFGDEYNGRDDLVSDALPRSRTIKNSLAVLCLDKGIAEEQRQSPEEEVVMDLRQKDLEYTPSPTTSSHYNAYYTAAEDDIGLGRDVEDDIDTALLSLISTSPESRFDTPKAETEQVSPLLPHCVAPSPASPLGKKRIWQERNGKWQRLNEEETQGLNNHADDRLFSYTATPPPLPPPPPTSAAKKQQKHSSDLRSGYAPASF